MYTITYFGDYEERLNWFNDFHSKESIKKSDGTRCSLFTAYTNNGKSFLGRNFDRNHEIPVLAKFSAPGKYASFAFSPASEVYLFEILKNPNPTEEQRNKLLYCLPFYSTDGINEKGLSIAIAGAPPRKIKNQEVDNRIFVLYFIRQVLDNCKNIEEVTQYAKTVSIYDSDYNTISHHFIVVDANRNWLVIDYPDGSLRIKQGQGTPAIRTNHFLDGGAAIEDNSFWRYDKLYSALNSGDTLECEADAMNILKQVQNNTKWSVVYESSTCSGIVTVNENYKTQLRFKF
jgi:predicted choloylglycine hydrolase